jgi:hypothetical protein
VTRLGEVCHFILPALLCFALDRLRALGAGGLFLSGMGCFGNGGIAIASCPQEPIASLGHQERR